MLQVQLINPEGYQQMDNITPRTDKFNHNETIQNIAKHNKSLCIFYWKICILLKTNTPSGSASNMDQNLQSNNVLPLSTL